MAEVLPKHCSGCRTCMLKTILADFRETVSELNLALREDNPDQVSEIDVKLSRVWQDIMEYQPSNPEEACILAEFLFDQLSLETDPESHDSQIRQKILDLVRTRHAGTRSNDTARTVNDSG